MTDRIEYRLWRKLIENSVIDHNGAVYTKNDIELSWLIGLGVNYDENKIR